ncbi:MAG: DNA repair protein RadA [Candidatus Blackburnbacteria bacterium RIFCSPHIGHO2_01_FULL_40_17]|nr:MAG: DNA repair protein RadA [Candidatus Blackburnbacteria bacterium RIFCSPHIGHO2_01_FULL_40_17]HBL51690.1 DNA repair protein RadA [Candidatus Blackburnbacteria bacterium]
MPRSSIAFVCQQCGHSSPKWMGQCPDCGSWNSFVETEVGQFKSKSKIGHSTSRAPILLSQIKKEDYSRRLSTKIAELDRVLGGGLVPGMVALVAGEPGIGKSTLLLQVANNIDGQVVYVAGEESSGQIANRAERIGAKGKNILVLEETDVDEILSQMSQMGHMGLMIVDSIQTLTTNDLTGGAGSIGQVRECAARLSSYCKRIGLPLLLVGHVNKEGSIAGPRVLEHMVDSVIWFEGDRREMLRVLRSIKNRFGATDEVGIFSMGQEGLFEVGNPSELFLGNTKGVPGSCTTTIIEGTRPLLLEVQALTASTKLAFPKRSASGMDLRRLEVIIAVLTRRVGLPLWEYDIYVNAVGGIKVAEPATDLAVALSIASSFYNKPLPSLVAIGEVGLLGEVREVVQLDRRVKEAKRLGFKTFVTSREAKTVIEAIKKYLSQTRG